MAVVVPLNCWDYLFMLQNDEKCTTKTLPDCSELLFPTKQSFRIRDFAERGDFVCDKPY